MTALAGCLLMLTISVAKGNFGSFDIHQYFSFFDHNRKREKMETTDHVPVVVCGELQVGMHISHQLDR